MGKIYKLTCKCCGKTFDAPSPGKRYCSDECKHNSKETGICVVCGKEFKKYSKRQNTCSSECHRILHNQQNSENLQRKHKSKEGIEGYDFVTCQICGAHLNNFSDKHFAMHGVTRAEYEERYGKITQWTAQKYIDEHFMNDNNPNSSSKVDEQTRKERSPYSKEYYKVRGLDDSVRTEFISGIEREYNTRIEYYMNRGYDMEDAEEMLHDRQSTFSLKKCIERYGKEDGTRRWKERNEKWIETLKNRPDYGEIISRRTRDTGFSEVSQIMFDRIHRRLIKRGFDLKEYYALHNHEFPIRDGKKVYLLDYAIPELGYAIEYNGEKFHVNKESMTEDDRLVWSHMYTNEDSESVIARDDKKASAAKCKGYDLKIVWHKDYTKDPFGVVNKCVDEIIEKYRERYPDLVDADGNIKQTNNL